MAEAPNMAVPTGQQVLAEAPNMAAMTEQQLPAEAPAQDPVPGSSSMVPLNASASSRAISEHMLHTCTLSAAAGMGWVIRDLSIGI